MNIQSLSICVPAQKCINDCEFCCSKMHGGEYEDRFTPIATTMSYIEDMKKRLQYARDNGCNTLMLTGNNEPQQNKNFLRVLGIVNKSLKDPFLNIEMQTSGAFIDDEMLDFLKEVGVTTMAISVACLDNNLINQKIIKTPDSKLNIDELCRKIKKRNMNLRICLNMNDNMLFSLTDDKCTRAVRIKNALLDVIDICKGLKADQITCRALWTSDDGTSQANWIKENVTTLSYDFIKHFKDEIKARGKYLDTLEYGANRYDFEGFSVVVDEDSMAQEKNKTGVKYLILRPDGHLYSKWESKASRVF